MRLSRTGLIIACTLLCSLGFTQQPDSVLQLPAGYVASIEKRSNDLSASIDAHIEKGLRKLFEEEEKLKEKLKKLDPESAERIFPKQNASEIITKLNGSAHYIPFLDTMNTSLQFLQGLNTANLPTGVIADALCSVKHLQEKFTQAEALKKYLSERKQYLMTQLKQFGLVKDLRRLNKHVYYYSARINEYRSILSDPKKIERKAIELLTQTKLFRDFMRKHSMLASLFRMPVDDPNDPAYLASLSGLQTRAQVNALIQNTIAAGGPGAQQQVSNNIQAAQAQLQQLKNKVAQFGGSNSADELPDFKPNSQKTKSFFKRLEFGTNIQTQRARNIFPVTTDLGLSVGYKLNDKSIVGVGASYKMGWGTGWRNIDITHQGVGLRSFIDWKLKGSFYVSGGYEMNYRNVILSVDQLRGKSGWQESGLVGLSKIVSVRSKVFKKVKVQVMWDFMSYEQVPVSQPIIFRFNYSF